MYPPHGTVVLTYYTEDSENGNGEVVLPNSPCGGPSEYGIFNKEGNPIPNPRSSGIFEFIYDSDGFVGHMKGSSMTVVISDARSLERCGTW